MQGITVTEARASAAKGSYRALSRRRYVVDFLPKVKIEIVLGDDMVEKAVEAIRRAAQTAGLATAKFRLHHRGSHPDQNGGIGSDAI